MILRVALIAAMTLVCGPAFAVMHVRPVPGVPAKAPITFYVVKGAPDACGHGCDRWIAVDGQIDANAAARFRKFLSRQRDRTLPFYFSSPGGNLDQAVAMGNMLHEKPALARVARTMVSECGFEAQDGEVCVKLKESGRELHGAFFTRNAICASACPYVMLGATAREIAPDVALGVHSAKVIMKFRGSGLPPPPSMVAAATERSREHGDHLLKDYFTRVGADTALLDLARSVKFENIHILTREEIARFGIDRRDFVETPWSLDNSGHNALLKIAVLLDADAKSFRMAEWRVFCFDRNFFEMDFVRPAPASASFSLISASLGAKPLYFGIPPAKAAGFEVWRARMTNAQVQLLADQSEMKFTETSLASDGHRVPQTEQLSGDGFAVALESLLTTCPLPKAPTLPQTTASGDHFGK
jgi:hypothetical protein